MPLTPPTSSLFSYLPCASSTTLLLAHINSFPKKRHLFLITIYICRFLAHFSWQRVSVFSFCGTLICVKITAACIERNREEDSLLILRNQESSIQCCPLMANKMSAGLGKSPLARLQAARNSSFFRLLLASLVCFQSERHFQEDVGLMSSVLYARFRQSWVPAGKRKLEPHNDVAACYLSLSYRLCTVWIWLMHFWLNESSMPLCSHRVVHSVLKYHLSNRDAFLCDWPKQEPGHCRYIIFPRKRACMCLVISESLNIWPRSIFFAHCTSGLLRRSLVLFVVRFTFYVSIGPLTANPL